MIESSRNGAEMVSDLASAIKKKIVDPAAGRIDIISVEIGQISKKVEGLEKEISLLQTAHSRTRVLALISLLGLAWLVIILALFK